MPRILTSVSLPPGPSPASKIELWGLLLLLEVLLKLMFYDYILFKLIFYDFIF